MEARYQVMESEPLQLEPPLILTEEAVMKRCGKPGDFHTYSSVLEVVSITLQLSTAKGHKATKTSAGTGSGA
jgi:hypothetical protein